MPLLAGNRASWAPTRQEACSLSCQSQRPKAWDPGDERELSQSKFMCEENVSTHEFGERTEVPLWLRKHFGRQGTMKHVRPEKYTDNDFSYVKEAWRRRASRDPGGATPALRKQHAVEYDGRLSAPGQPERWVRRTGPSGSSARTPSGCQSWAQGVPGTQGKIAAGR